MNFVLLMSFDYRKEAENNSKKANSSTTTCNNKQHNGKEIKVSFCHGLHTCVGNLIDELTPKLNKKKPIFLFFFFTMLHSFIYDLLIYYEN
jgi:hypothetical protein